MTNLSLVWTTMTGIITFGKSQRYRKKKKKKKKKAKNVGIVARCVLIMA